jgi:hypothetical protein
LIKGNVQESYESQACVIRETHDTVGSPENSIQEGYRITKLLVNTLRIAQHPNSHITDYGVFGVLMPQIYAYLRDMKASFAVAGKDLQRK